MMQNTTIPCKFPIKMKIDENNQLFLLHIITYFKEYSIYSIKVPFHPFSSIRIGTYITISLIVFLSQVVIYRAATYL